MTADEQQPGRAQRPVSPESADAPADVSVLERLAVLAQEVGTAADLTGVYRSLLRFATAVVPTSGLYVSLYDAARQERTCVYAWSEGREDDISQLPSLPMSDSPNSRSVSTNRVIVTDELQAALAGQPRVDLGMDVDPREPQSSIAVPMAVLGRVIGGFEVQSTQRHAYRAEHVTAMRMAANLAAIATENVQLLDRERELRAAAETSEQRHRDLVQGLDAIVYEADVSHGRLTFISQRAEAILGFSVEECLRDPGLLQRQVHRDDRETVQEALRRATASGGRREIEYRIHAADGRVVWVRDVLVVTGDAAGTGALRRGVMIDISERKRAEAQSVHAQRMESVGRLAGAIAHDFNNLLTAITGYAELAMSEIPVESSAREDVAEIRKAAVRASDLTSQLLAFSRRQVLQPRVVELNAVVAGLEPLLRRLIGENIALTVALGDDAGRVRVDRSQLEQVIVNLAVNARDAMPGGGSLVIRTASTALVGSARGEPAVLQPGDYATIAVSDTGSGIDPATLPNVFEPFFTTKRRGEGTGLGLATAYGTIRQSGGDIDVRSEPGQGTAFVVYLPQVEEPVDVREGREQRRRLPRGAETVLVAEDEDAVRALVCGVLRRNGYTVLDAADGATALARAERHPRAIDLLVTDLVMPGMSGVELADALIRSRPGLKVLYMSGYTEDSAVRQRVGNPGSFFLEKPFTLDELSSTVRTVLDSDEPDGVAAHPAGEDVM